MMFKFPLLSSARQYVAFVEKAIAWLATKVQGTVVHISAYTLVSFNKFSFLGKLSTRKRKITALLWCCWLYSNSDSAKAVLQYTKQTECHCL